MLAHVYDKDGFYVRSENCPIDPLESERTEALVWLAPADATLKTPPAFSSGQWPRWTGEDWELVEDHRVIRNEQGEVVSGTETGGTLRPDIWISPGRCRKGQCFPLRSDRKRISTGRRFTVVWPSLKAGLMPMTI